ncbi:MAG TPA: GNAT family N-acetyltransferase [Thermoplasmata archaeon]|nr:GNAT family N-acetyltransferase [Thermoplasmata archaeon]
MTNPHHRAEAHESTPNDPEGQVRLRLATEKDLPTLIPVLLRLKRLNEEFDPLLKVRADADERAREILKADLHNPKSVLLVAEGARQDAGKIVGVVRATVRERPFYIPEYEGVIQDIYLLPLYRRHGVGEYLLKETVRYLKERGAGLVTAEFPTQNEIASKFYTKRGFRPITALHAKML